MSRSLGFLLLILTIIGVLTLAIVPDPCSTASYDERSCLQQKAWKGDRTAQDTLDALSVHEYPNQ